MDPYGNYAIYFLDIFGTFEATLVAYLLGVLTVLTLGLEGGYLLERLLRPKAEKLPLSDLDKEEREIGSLEMSAEYTHIKR